MQSNRFVLEESSYSQEVTFAGTLLHGNQSTGMVSTDHSMGRGRAREEAMQGEEDVQEEEDVQCIGLVLIIQVILLQAKYRTLDFRYFGVGLRVITLNHGREMWLICDAHLTDLGNAWNEVMKC